MRRAVGGQARLRPHHLRSLSSRELLSSAPAASFAQSAASRSHASRSTGLIAFSAFRRHSSASRRYRFAAVSDFMAGSSKWLWRRFGSFCAVDREERLGPTSHAYGVPSAPSAMTSRGGLIEPAPLQIKQQIAPVLRALASTIGEADQFLAAFRRRGRSGHCWRTGFLRSRVQITSVACKLDPSTARILHEN
jgi:hypothetical protein